MSLDGFVAGPNGELNWAKVDEEIFDHVGKRISKSTIALYGRVTYQMMENYWPAAGIKPGASKHDIEHSEWYNTVHKVVLSKTLTDKNLNNTKFISDNLSERINEIKHSHTGGSDDILIFGSPTATHSLLKENLIDGFWLFVNPIILGKGVPLFTDIQDRMKLKLMTTHPFSSGVTELNYLLERD